MRYAGRTPLALHSATLVGDNIVVFGGNRHTHFTDEQCYSMDTLVYNVQCASECQSLALSIHVLHCDFVREAHSDSLASTESLTSSLAASVTLSCPG